MLDIKNIRQNKEEVKQNISKRGMEINLDEILEIDEQKRQYIQEAEELKAELNKISQQKPDEQIIKKAKEIKEQIKDKEFVLQKIVKKFDKLIVLLPNLVLADVPEGKGEANNKIVKEVGAKTVFDFEPKDYLTLAEKLDLIDVVRATKTSGARFGFIKGQAALLEFALINLALEVLTKNSFVPVVPPVMLKPEAMQAMGYLDRHSDEIYHLTEDDLYLVGTSEQSVGAMHLGETFQLADLPRRYVSFSTCFRREAGSYGKDTKGILRVHQFDKVEMFVFSEPDKSVTEHENLLKMEEELVSSLKIPYRVMNLCAADLGYPSAKTYDIECWLPGQNQYRETHSTSNCTDFQARRLNTRYRDKDNKIKFVHTLNGTAFAIGRMIIAIIENYQQADGSILVPEVLQKYLGVKKIG